VTALECNSHSNHIPCVHIFKGVHVVDYPRQCGCKVLVLIVCVCVCVSVTALEGATAGNMTPAGH